MKPDHSRRYSREEMKQILEVASREAPGASGSAPDGDGLTLAEIQDIGREVGIDPVRVARASASLAAATPIDPRVSLGTYQLERLFPRRLDPDEMRFVAEEANHYFGVQGRLRQTQHYVEWHSEEGRAFVGVVHDSRGTRVRVILDRASQFYLGGGAIGLLGLVLGSSVLSAAPGLIGVAGAAVVGVLSVVALAGFWKWRKAAAIRRLEGLLDLMLQGPVSLSGPGGDP